MDKLFDHQGYSATPVRPDSDTLAYGGGYVNPDADTRLGEFLGAIEYQQAMTDEDAYWEAKLAEEWAERQVEGENYIPSSGEVDAALMAGPCLVWSPEGALRMVLHPVTRKIVTGEEAVPFCRVPEHCETIIRRCKERISDEIAYIHALTA